MNRRENKAKKCKCSDRRPEPGKTTKPFILDTFEAEDMTAECLFDNIKFIIRDALPVPGTGFFPVSNGFGSLPATLPLIALTI